MATASTKPYLLRALYEWCVDQDLTPYLVVAVDEYTRVPRPFVKDGQITLNISPIASNQLQIGNELITFQARFSGQVQHLSIPVGNVAAIFAKETGEGMGFDLEIEATDADVGFGEPEVVVEPAPEITPPEPPPAAPRPKLTRVK